MLVFPIFAGFSNKNYDKKRIQPWIENQWYWQYDNKPVLLLGASNHDNLFQWTEEMLIPHLDSMKKVGANYVRNIMSDSEKDYELYPFLLLKNGKYDLTQWNNEYWERFEFFLKETKKRKIIVQIEIWDRFDYSRDNWHPNPINPKNNENYTYEETGFIAEYPLHPGFNKQPFFYTTPKQRNNEILLNYQKKFVEKVLSISLSYNHVLYCIDNESGAEEEWAAFWADFIKSNARKVKKNICVTQMWDNGNLNSKEQKRTFDHLERYAYCDVSQNNHKKGQEHWDNFQWVRDYISTQPRPLNTVKTYGADGGPHGNTKDGIERWWKHVLGGAASARFHRPVSGLGLSSLSMNSIKVARQIEKEVNFWELKPGNEMLSNRGENEAYLTSKPGEAYVLFFSNGGNVSLNLTEYGSEFSLKWFEIRTGKLHFKSLLKGGEIVNIAAPENLEWIALISKTQK